MPTDFITMDYILTFAGMVVIVNMLTQFTKGLFDKLLIWNRTKWVVAGYSFLLGIIAAIWKGNFSSVLNVFETCFIWLINSVIVWFTAMKAYETIVED